jgi:CopG family nickel-responsive transcriptional regulator
MKRITISVDDELALQFEAWVKREGYENRSEAFRDLVRHKLDATSIAKGKARHCVATVSYVYNHHERHLAGRLMDAQHNHHDLTLSAMHAHLDHDDCIETLILRGPTEKVTAFARTIIAEKGVRHGLMNVIPVRVHKRGAHTHHQHVRPLT